MTTIKSLHEDLLYTILSKCSSSIDMWHLLLALDYELTTMINLRAFWSHIRLTSLHNQNILFSFIKAIAQYCIDLRLDNLHWMTAIDLRRLLSSFRLVVNFHTGNVALSKSLLIHDIKHFFPFLKSINLLIAIDDQGFQDLWTSLNEINQLEYISFVLQDKKGGCLSDLNAGKYLRLGCECISNMTNQCRLISMEENGYEMKNRFVSKEISARAAVGAINLSLSSILKHLIISFRSMFNVNLTLESKDLTNDKVQLQTLVLPCVPINSLDLSQLQMLDIGYLNVQNRMELTRLDEILLAHRNHSLRNLTISLSEWQAAKLVVIWRKEDNKQAPTQFPSVFENCFDQIITPEEEIAKPSFTNPSNLIDEFSLELLDDTQSIIFQFPLNDSWLNKLTNLNLTGIHCHSMDLKYIFNSLHLLRSLSLSPCLLLYLDQLECHCLTSLPYQIHSLNHNLLSLNLVSHLSNPKEFCLTFLEQYKLHCIRHSSIHQYLANQESLFLYENLIRYSIRRIIQTFDLHHLSLRLPNYEFHLDDLDIQNPNHLQTLIIDVKIPLTFHTKLAGLYSRNSFNHLRRFILISENHFELTPLLIDRFRMLEIIEIISVNSHLNRSVINYLERVLQPKNYPNLNTFRYWIGSVDAKHLLKHLHKTIRLAFEKVKPGFQFDVAVINSTRKCILYDHTHEIHRDFHSLSTIHSNQLSIIYPNFLNYKPLYSEEKFEK